MFRDETRTEREKRRLSVQSSRYVFVQNTRRKQRNSVTRHITRSLCLKLLEYFISIDFLAVDNQSHTYFHLSHETCRREVHHYLLLNVVRAVENIKAGHGMCLNI
jgi:hypothetical protein